MVTCNRCRKEFSEEIIVLPSGSHYPKRVCLEKSMEYPLRYYKCPHCKLPYVKMDNGEYEFFEGRLPYAQ